MIALVKQFFAGVISFIINIVVSALLGSLYKFIAELIRMVNPSHYINIVLDFVVVLIDRMDKAIEVVRTKSPELADEMDKEASESIEEIIAKLLVCESKFKK